MTRQNPVKWFENPNRLQVNAIENHFYLIIILSIIKININHHFLSKFLCKMTVHNIKNCVHIEYL